MKLAEIWRYPVKSMAGEPLSRAVLGSESIPGDRVVHVEDADGRVVTSRSRPKLLLLHATLGADGEPLVDGRPWQRADVARDVEQAAGAGARLVRDEGLDRFDVLPLLVATDGAIASLGYDRRRFRPNLLLSGVPGLAERGWGSGSRNNKPVFTGKTRTTPDGEQMPAYSRRFRRNEVGRPHKSRRRPRSLAGPRRTSRAPVER